MMLQSLKRFGVHSYEWGTYTHSQRLILSIRLNQSESNYIKDGLFWGKLRHTILLTTTLLSQHARPRAPCVTGWRNSVVRRYYISLYLKIYIYIYIYIYT